MDSDGSSSSSTAAKIRHCRCGRRMSSLGKDFHSVCINCRGIDFDVDNRCNKDLQPKANCLLVWKTVWKMCTRFHSP